jgi:hypothetical protein
MFQNKLLTICLLTAGMACMTNNAMHNTSKTILEQQQELETITHRDDIQELCTFCSTYGYSITNEDRNDPCLLASSILMQMATRASQSGPVAPFKRRALKQPESFTGKPRRLTESSVNHETVAAKTQQITQEVARNRDTIKTYRGRIQTLQQQCNSVLTSEQETKAQYAQAASYIDELYEHINQIENHNNILQKELTEQLTTNDELVRKTEQMQELINRLEMFMTNLIENKKD